MSGRKSQQEALRRVNQGLYQKLNDLRAAKDAEIAALKEEVAEANASALNAQQIAIKKMNEATRLRAEIQRLRRFVERVANDAEEIVYFEEGRSMFDGEMRRYIDYSLLKGMANDALLTPEDGKPLEAPAPDTDATIRSIQIKAWDAIREAEIVGLNKGYHQANTNVWDESERKKSDSFIGQMIEIRARFDEFVDRTLSKGGTNE